MLLPRKLSRCERAVSGRAQEREAELACRFGPRAAGVPFRPRARRRKAKVPVRRGKTAGHKVKWAERVGPAREKLSRCERAVSGRGQHACRFGPCARIRKAKVPVRRGKNCWA